MISVARSRRISANAAIAAAAYVRVRALREVEEFVACAAGDGLAGNFLDVMQDGGDAVRCRVPSTAFAPGRS